MPLRHPRSARLLRPDDYAALREHSRRTSTVSFSVQYRMRPQSGARLGMAVSRRVSKLAVERNRIRRQVRESFRLHRPELPDLDILVIARANAAAQTSVALRTELESIWRMLTANVAPPLKDARSPGTMRAS
jgi:ribonuclease P protein component